MVKQTDAEKKAKKAKQTKALNKENKVKTDAELKKARSTARNATAKLNAFKEGAKWAMGEMKNMLREVQ